MSRLNKGLDQYTMQELHEYVKEWNDDRAKELKSAEGLSLRSQDVLLSTIHFLMEDIGFICRILFQITERLAKQNQTKAESKS